MSRDVDRSSVFVGGEDLTDEVKILSDRAEFTGTYSHIFKGACRGERVAIKVLKLVSRNLNTTKRKFRRELAVWKHVNHPNISPFYGYTEGDGEFGPVGALISPWYDNGDAETFLQEKGEFLSIEQRIDLWKGVVLGVCYLHEQDPRVVHGDLKPSNILIDESGSPRICDFGLAYIYLEEGHTGFTTTSPHTGTERYLAPELLEDRVQPSTASDIWALGCIGLQLLYSIIPYQHRISNRNGLIFQDIRQGILPATLPADNDARLAPFSQILVKCWFLLPSERIDAPDILLLINDIDDQEIPSPVEVIYDNVFYLPEKILTPRKADTLPTGVDALGALPLSSGLQEEMPSDLRLDHSRPTEIIMNPDGVVKAATLRALIERLTMHTDIDARFNDAFVMMFKSFSNIDQVFDMLVERYNIQPQESLTPDQLAEWTEKEKIPVQLRSINVMCDLIDGIEKEDLHILGRVETFANDVTLNDPDSKDIAMSLLHNVLRMQWNGVLESKQTMYTTIFDSPPPSIRSQTMDPTTLLDIDPLELARQLTIIESELFREVKPSECIAYSREPTYAGLDSLKSIFAINDKMKDWVVHAVFTLSKKDIRLKAAVVKHFINTADHCRALANYSSMASIVTGLNSPPVRRIHETWSRLSIPAKAVLINLEDTIDAERGFQAYKERISKLQRPCVPFLKAHLTDLISIQNSKEYDLENSTLINFQKCQAIADVVAGIMKHRIWEYDLMQVHHIRQFIDESLGALDNIPDLVQLHL